jgi:Lrp/AsnC family transcriptional regulator for asnA, asnC and gidA
MVPLTAKTIKVRVGGNPGWCDRWLKSPPVSNVIVLIWSRYSEIRIYFVIYICYYSVCQQIWTNYVPTRAKPASDTDTPNLVERITVHTNKPVHDKLNREIITILQEDGRTSYSTIASKLGVSEGAVRKRVGRLQSSGALRVVAVVDPLMLSYDAYTMLGIKVPPNHQPEEVAQRLSQSPDVVYAIWVSGPYDLLVEVIFEDKAEFVNYLSDQIYGHSDIQGCEVMHNLKVVKNQYYLKPEFEREPTGAAVE